MYTRGVFVLRRVYFSTPTARACCVFVCVCARARAFVVDGEGGRGKGEGGGGVASRARVCVHEDAKVRSAADIVGRIDTRVDPTRKQRAQGYWHEKTWHALAGVCSSLCVGTERHTRASQRKIQEEGNEKKQENDTHKQKRVSARDRDSCGQRTQKTTARQAGDTIRRGRGCSEAPLGISGRDVPGQVPPCTPQARKCIKWKPF